MDFGEEHGEEGGEVAVSIDGFQIDALRSDWLIGQRTGRCRRHLLFKRIEFLSFLTIIYDSLDQFGVSFC